MLRQVLYYDSFIGERLTFDLCLFSTLVVQTPILPPTITDQIRLWELERDRLQFTEGECVSDPDSNSGAS